VRNTTKTYKFLQFHRGEPGIFKHKLPRTCTSVHFRRHYADCFNSTASTEKLPPHHFCFVQRVRKTTNINDKKFFILKPVVRTQRSYKRVGLIKRQKSCQGLVMFGHEMLISLQMRAKLFETHFLLCFLSDIRLRRMTFYSLKNVGNIARLPVSCQIWRMLTFE
jgi:hypothetical protein